MAFKSFVLSVVCASIMEVLVSIIMPEGRMKSFTLSIISIYIFYAIAFPLCQFLQGGGFGNLF